MNYMKTYTREQLGKILGDAKNHTLQDTDEKNCQLDGKKIIISDFSKRLPGSNSEIFRRIKENSWGDPTLGETPKTPKEAKKVFDKAIKQAKKESDSLKSDIRLPSRF